MKEELKLEIKNGIKYAEPRVEAFTTPYFSKENMKMINPQLETEEELTHAYHNEVEFVFNFYANFVNLHVKLLIFEKKFEEANEALEKAIGYARNSQEVLKKVFIPFLILIRNLVDVKIQLSDIVAAESLLEDVHELLSSNSYAFSTSQNPSGSFVVDRFDPIRERIKTIIHLARVKQLLAKWDDSETLLRIAMKLTKEKSG